MRRVVIPELLDSDAGTPDEIRAGINDLRNINRWFGGVRTAKRLLEEVSKRTSRRDLSVLEVASGSGYVPAAVQRALGTSSKLSFTLLDRAPSHLNGYRPSVAAEATALPFADGSFDVVSCCLFAHHLESKELMTFAREALRVCRVAFVINDLRRSALHLALVYAGLPLFRSRLTWHDAPASVRRAYTKAEVIDALANAGIGDFTVFRSYLFRMGVIVWK